MCIKAVDTFDLSYPRKDSIYSVKSVLCFIPCSISISQNWYFVTKIVLTYCEKKLYW